MEKNMCEGSTVLFSVLTDPLLPLRPCPGTLDVHSFFYACLWSSYLVCPHNPTTSCRLILGNTLNIPRLVLALSLVLCIWHYSSRLCIGQSRLIAIKNKHKTHTKKPTYSFHADNIQYFYETNSMRVFLVGRLSIKWYFRDAGLWPYHFPRSPLSSLFS